MDTGVDGTWCKGRWVPCLGKAPDLIFYTQLSLRKVVGLTLPAGNWIRESELEQPPLEAFSPPWDHFHPLGHQCLGCGFHVTFTMAWDTLSTPSYALAFTFSLVCWRGGKSRVLWHFKNVCQTVWWKTSSKACRLCIRRWGFFLPGCVFLNFL